MSVELKKLGLDFLEKYALKVSLMRSNDRIVVEIKPEDLPNVIKSLIEKFGERGVLLSTIAGVDLPDEDSIMINYFINLINLKRYIVLRTKLNRDNPRIKSLLSLGINGALSGECETYDLLGIVFDGNKYLKRGFFVPMDVAEKGIYPLRKEFKV